ncbi:hypothetical protein ScPMuIL_010333 [Solemya velum]
MAASKVKIMKKTTYFETLDSVAKARYLNKLKSIDNLDPYTMDAAGFSDDPTLLPSVKYANIYTYLVNTPSPYTKDELECYKGLDAYNQFLSGWVRDVKTTIVNNLHLVIGRVMHSQRLRETALKPWLVVEKNGKVVFVHCDCMAGLGETCTHVSALLFCVETKARIRDDRTVTQAAAYWKLPPSIRDVVYKPIFEMDFMSAKSKKKALDKLVDNNVATTPGKRQVKGVLSTKADDLQSLFEKFSMAGSKAGVLRVVPDICKKFKPTSLSEEFPLILTSLYKYAHIDLDFSMLLAKCEAVELTVSPEQSKSVEQATRTQAAGKLWFHFRSGRVTASNMKRVCRTDPDQPSQSLVRTICYPESTAFSVAATRWGCAHEKTAREQYSNKMGASHDNFAISDSGFASPVRIEGDPTMWDVMVASSKEFHTKAILPELLGKFYTRAETPATPLCEDQMPSNNTTAAGEPMSRVYCYCGLPEDHDMMIGCEDENCEIEWYHLICLKIKKVPKGKWICPECRKRASKSKTKKQTSKPKKLG